jgi:microcystin-dependent protein
MDIKTITLIIFGIIILYLLYKTRKIESSTGKIEPFATTDAINAAINNKYKIDMDAMRNLAGISKKIMDAGDVLTLPAGTTEMKGDGFIHKSLGVYGDLKVTGNVIFNNKNSNIMEIYPAFMIMMWLGNVDPLRGDVGKPPKGWCICDGKWYKIGPDGHAIEGTSTDGLQTPDLRGRFPVGAGTGSIPNENGGPLTYKPLWQTGGSETHTLTVAQMPSHSHGGIPPYSDNCYGNGDCKGAKGFVSNTWEKNSHNTGGNQPHNNMPPWYAINFIMKL